MGEVGVDISVAKDALLDGPDGEVIGGGVVNLNNAETSKITKMCEEKQTTSQL